MSNAIVRKWSDQTYPGFEQLKTYIESCGIIDYKNGEVHRSDNDGCIWFRDSSSGRSQADMEYVLNTPKFRHYHNLFPAGTDPVVAFCQLMVLRYRSQLNLDNESGTYLIEFHLWGDVYTSKNEAQMSQQVNFSYSAANKQSYRAIVCL